MSARAIDSLNLATLKKAQGRVLAEALAKELLDYEIRISEDANERCSAFREGSHDDFVTALGLATMEDATGRTT